LQVKSSQLVNPNFLKRNSSSSVGAKKANQAG
jgi:hypothetical protein